VALDGAVLVQGAAPEGVALATVGETGGAETDVGRIGPLGLWHAATEVTIAAPISARAKVRADIRSL
jgi:hypothetical protein